MKDDLRKLMLEAIEKPIQSNDEEFLTETDKIQKEYKPKQKVKRKCDNCTCEMKDNVWDNSSCVNCGKGDAFRCSDCPSRGLPAYETGDVIKFD
ncbi:anamorsin-like protein [Vairimorpha apis BRL 01]|uniref:Anamorsin-like protein n=1 Tax=Vairimorpha apis BRL 01 TaxID=1037528 RepID=T0MG47_9MICR|nr:anamorsin-like protein [Vairimorpha apis BRL 01]